MSEVRDMFVHPGPQPNGLQAAEDGLWVIDQTDNHLYKLDWEDGSTLAKLPTETEHSSGVTIGAGSVWVASTYSCELFRCSPDDGSTIARHDTPGKGVVAYSDPDNPVVTGAHGMEWVDDENMWVAVPPAQRVYLMDPGTMSVKHSIPTPGIRPHGIFMHEGDLWLPGTQDSQDFRIGPENRGGGGGGCGGGPGHTCTNARQRTAK
ncbi:MAG: hypothetical protein OXC95_13395, partial [Dehalococcoidia bacterium]|nr:hypothetical protein [Dehalococcoidia bacterium]